MEVALKALSEIKVDPAVAATEKHCVPQLGFNSQVQHITEDAREELFVRYLRYLLYANAKRGGTYPLCVSAERVCQAQRVAAIAVELGSDAIAHGSTGAGNDQVRFDVVFSVVAPNLELLTPIRTLGLNWAMN